MHPRVWRRGRDLSFIPADPLGHPGLPRPLCAHIPVHVASTPAHCHQRHWGGKDRLGCKTPCPLGSGTEGAGARPWWLLSCWQPGSQPWRRRLAGRRALPAPGSTHRAAAVHVAACHYLGWAPALLLLPLGPGHHWSGGPTDHPSLSWGCCPSLLPCTWQRRVREERPPTPTHWCWQQRAPECASMGQLVLQPAPTVSLSPQTRHLPAVWGQRLSPSATLRWWQSRSCSHVCSASPGLSRQCRCPRHARTYMHACTGACSHACPRRPTHAHLPKCMSAETNMHPCTREHVGTPTCLCTPLVHTPPHTSTPRFTHTCICPCTHPPHAHPCRCKHHTHTYMRALPCTHAPTCVHAAPTGLSPSLQCGTGCSRCCGSSSLPPAPAFLSPCHPIGTLVSSLVPLHRLQPPPPCHPRAGNGSQGPGCAQPRVWG